MEQANIRQILVEALKEISPDEVEMGYYALDQVIEGALSGAENIEAVLPLEKGVPPNELLPILNDLLVTAKIVLVCVHIWNATKQKPDKDDFTKKCVKDVAPEISRSRQFKETVHRIYNWLSGKFE